VSVALQRFGQISSFHQFLLGATLGAGLKFWDAFWAFTIGSVVLEIITILIGIIGVRQGLSTSVVARWTGLGRKGSALVGLLMTISLVGWFAFQNSFFAKGLQEVTGVLPFWAWSLIGGIAVTLIVIYGFHAMTWTAYITVPAFLALAIYAAVTALQDHSLTALINSAPVAAPDDPKVPHTLTAGVTIVAGAFMIGAIMTPDMTRYNRNNSDVVKQTLIGVTLGQYLVGMTGVLLAHVVSTNQDAAQLITASAGMFGVIILIAAILKINDWNLYSSGLGLVNTIQVLFGKKINRTTATLILGVIGATLSALGAVDYFVPFLNHIGIITPPVAGIMIAEYYVVRRWRAQLESTREAGTLPSHAPDWIVSSLVCWAGGALVGYYVTWGFPTINSVVSGFLLYVIIGSLLARTDSEPATAHA
jgi:cytosine permease